jgi:hypothetical protein
MGTVNFAGVAKESLVSTFRPGALQLLTNDPTGGQTRPAALFLEPIGKLRCKSNTDCMTHKAKT